MPIHMQRDSICERRVPPYRLRVEVDGAQLEDARVEAAGARQDRPVFVFREFALEPGRHQVRVEFAQDEDDIGAAIPRPDVPPPLILSAPVAFEAGQIRLVSYDATSNRLVLLPD